MADKKKLGWLSTLITIIVIAAAIFIYNTYFGSHPNEYIAYYRNVKGLQESSPVMIKGVRVGKIKSIDLLPNGLLKVTFGVNEDIQITKGSKAMLASAGVLSDKVISIVKDTGNVFLPSGSTLTSALDSSAMNASVQVTPYLVTAKYILRSADSTLSSINELTKTGLVKNFITPLSNFERTIKTYENLSNGYVNKSDSIVVSITRLNVSAVEIATSSKEWKKDLQNIQEQTNSIAKSDIPKSIAGLRESINTIRNITRSGTTLETEAADKKTYTAVGNSLDSMNRSMKDLYNAPPGFTIFGKSKKKK